MEFLIITGLALLLWLVAKQQMAQKKRKLYIGRMFQMLESFHVIDNTIKLDIFTQRPNFIGELASALPPVDADKDKYIDMALQVYTHKYSDRTISSTIRLILSQPQIATSPKFRDEAATSFFLRTCNKLKAETKTLKTTSAKQRRVTQATELSDTIVDRLTSNERQKYIDCIRRELASMSHMTTLRPIEVPK